mmetsp:Transcript_33657/g.60922  ORF Transcript_33657/g.60922 Transcript_33657/m.60922 type:complete len:223 (+) Transcript_33657:78-746(+)
MPHGYQSRLAAYCSSQVSLSGCPMYFQSSSDGVLLKPQSFSQAKSCSMKPALGPTNGLTLWQRCSASRTVNPSERIRNAMTKVHERETPMPQFTSTTADSLFRACSRNANPCSNHLGPLRRSSPIKSDIGIWHTNGLSLAFTRPDLAGLGLRAAAGAFANDLAEALDLPEALALGFALATSSARSSSQNRSSSWVTFKIWVTAAVFSHSKLVADLAPPNQRR